MRRRVPGGGLPPPQVSPSPWDRGSDSAGAAVARESTPRRGAVTTAVVCGSGA